MRAAKAIALAVLAFALLGGATAVAATFEVADGWTKWSVDQNAASGTSCCGMMSGKLTMYVRTKNGDPVDVRGYDANCGKNPPGAAADLGHLSQEQSDSLLLGIVKGRNLNIDAREEAMFWLVLIGSDATFEYVDNLLSSN